MIGFKNERYKESELSKPAPAKKDKKKDLTRKKRPKEKSNNIA
jgi:hypothetical protein